MVVSIDVGGPVNALALNKSTNQVGVAGRSLFKIYSITEKNTFELATNLRLVKNVVSGCSDIAWNQVDDNILASATPSGAIVIWNLNKTGFSKMDTVYQDHKRIVNRIRFHPTDPWLLISGSQDSIKVFDLRQSEAIINYSCLSEPVRDLQFCPSKANVFVAVEDCGYVQLHDIRKKDKFEQSFPAHNGPILACDWHPEQADLIATAGRDMSIKIWNMSSQMPHMQHCIPTIEPVSNVKWSYENKAHIASCSLKRDYSINVWDTDRIYIAYAKFTEPHEITTGMAWCRGVNSLISVTTNGNLYQLPISDAYRPLEHANPVGMAINPDGDIALAIGTSLRSNLKHGLNEYNNTSTSNNQSNLNQQSTFQTNLNNYSPISGVQASSSSFLGGTPQQNSLPTKFPYQALQSKNRSNIMRVSQESEQKPRISSRSQLDVYKCTQMNWFVKTAQEYQLSNRPLAELCDHNADVCAKLRRFQICQTWKILKLFYANINTSSTSQTTQTQQSNQNIANTSLSTNKQQPSTIVTVTGNLNAGIGEDQLSIESQQPGDSSEFSYMSKNNRLNFNNQNVMVGQQTKLMESTIDDDDGASSAASEQSNESSDEWLSHDTISYEAFQHKHDICGRVERLIEHRKINNNEDSASSSGSSNRDDDYTVQSFQTNPFKALGNVAAAASAITDNENDFKISHLINTKAYQFKFYEIIADVIADVLKYHVDNSDVQSAVSILIVLGDRIKNIVNDRIPEVDRESWYYSYIDLLSKFQLWNVMAQVINLSPLSNINSINQTSTTIYTTCGSCNKPLNGKVSWICERCKTKPSECSVCHGVVAGLMAWCQGCYHGGHLIHMSQWFSENDYCPTGCGHMCELSQWR